MNHPSAPFLSAPLLTVPLVMLSASMLVRSLSFAPAVIDTDEGLYMLQARAWLAGGWPFVAVWDMHPPGAPALIALAFALLGESIATVRLVGVVATAATATLLCAIVRALGGGRAAALAAGLLYVGQTPLFTGLATNTEILFAPFVALALWLALGGRERSAPPSLARLATMGVAIGLGLLIKQVVFFEGCLAFAVSVAPSLWHRRLGVARLIGSALLYALACALPIGLLFLLYGLRGEGATLWDALVLAPLRYRGEPMAAVEAAWTVASALIALLPAVLLAVLGLLRPPTGHARVAALGWLWLAAASIGVAAPGMFFAHYFLMLLPPLSLAAAAGAVRLAVALRPERPALLLALIVGVVAAEAWRIDAVPRLRSGVGLWRPDPVREVAEVLARTVPPGAAVLVANYHPTVLLLAGMEAPGRFVFPAQLTGHFSASLPVDADDELARILASAPAAIVLDRGWLHTLRPSALAAIEQAVADGYDLAGTVAEERGPVEVWRRRDPGGWGSCCRSGNHLWPPLAASSGAGPSSAVSDLL